MSAEPDTSVDQIKEPDATPTLEQIKELLVKILCTDKTRSVDKIKERIALCYKMLTLCIAGILLLGSGVGAVLLVDDNTRLWHVLSPLQLLSINLFLLFVFFLAFLLIVWIIDGLINQL